MKKRLSLSAFILISGFMAAQNLVPNADFESYTTCPYDQGQADYATGWQKSLNNNVAPSHTDYMNACNTDYWTTPVNIWGNQAPASGNAYMAMTTMCTSIAADYRENIYIQLTSPLVPGNTYSVSFSASLADDFKYSSDNLGAKFSTVPNFPINNTQHVGSGQITSQTAWTTVSGLVVPDSAYKYIAIGNFHQDIYTTQTTVCSSCNQPYNLYYIDDVSVTLVSSTGIKTNEAGAGISIYPNPNKGSFIVNLTSDASLKVRNCLGQLMTEKELNMKSNTVNLGNVEPGVYIVTLENETFQKNYKIIID
ncbi:MAG: T9SS type A sorting domain-containing protein [Bacteroidia bacterium]